MALTEFELIERYFATRTLRRDDVALGIGDDAALLHVPPGKELVVTTDTLVAGVHFPLDTPAADIGYRALAVNLSDLAAMGAEPAWATLALTLPQADETWLTGFADGFMALAGVHGVQLIGGDTTRGPLAVTVTLHGMTPTGEALRRSGARAGDGVFVSGCLGDAALALALLLQGALESSRYAEYLRQRFHRPVPRLELGAFLRNRAHSAIDISDGLLADLGHILDASGVGAVIEVPRLPLSDAMQWSVTPAQARKHALAGGDDYELCFTVPLQAEQEIVSWGAAHALPLTRIGHTTAEPGMRVVDARGAEVAATVTGYQHFL